MTQRIALASVLLGIALAFAPGAAQAQLSFHPVSPCRVLSPTTFTSGGADQAFPVRGLCGIPTGALAVAFNVTAQQTAIPGANQSNGRFTLYPGDLGVAPSASTINFIAGQNIANGAIVLLNPTPGASDVKANAFLAGGAGKQCNLILDVTGYYSSP